MIIVIKIFCVGRFEFYRREHELMEFSQRISALTLLLMFSAVKKMLLNFKLTHLIVPTTNFLPFCIQL